MSAVCTCGHSGLDHLRSGLCCRCECKKFVLYRDGVPVRKTMIPEERKAAWYPFKTFDGKRWVGWCPCGWSADEFKRRKDAQAAMEEHRCEAAEGIRLLRTEVGEL